MQFKCHSFVMLSLDTEDRLITTTTSIPSFCSNFSTTGGEGGVKARRIWSLILGRNLRMEVTISALDHSPAGLKPGSEFLKDDQFPCHRLLLIECSRMKNLTHFSAYFQKAIKTS